MLIDPKSSTPIYRQIADQMRGSIESGIFRPGEMLPSLRSLAIDIKVNPNTVQRAYDALEREGVVETHRGVGVFVAKAVTGKRSCAEQKLHSQLSRAIAQAVKAGLKPDAIRLSFEESMREFLAEAKR